MFKEINSNLFLKLILSKATDSVFFLVLLYYIYCPQCIYSLWFEESAEDGMDFNRLRDKFIPRIYTGTVPTEVY